MSVDELAAYLGVPKKTIYGCWRQWGLRGRRRMGHSATDRPGRAPSLHVQYPAAAQLSETICAAPKDDGFWFWWSWAEPIAQDPATTAAIIVRALRARPEPR
jgi:hypothetical protein